MDPPAKRAVGSQRRRSDQPAGAAGAIGAAAATRSSSSTVSTASSAAPPLRAAATGASPRLSFSPHLIMRPPAIQQQEPRPENPLLLLASSRAAKLSLGYPILDRLLSGGLPAASVTEIASESASGKTQLCLQLALSPLASSSLFLCSDLPFPLHRLRLLAPYPDLLDHVLVVDVHSPSDLLTLLYRAQHHLSHPSRSPIRLILIDSIASLFRDFGASPADLKRRSELFFKISAKLKELAYRHQCVVVVTNQVVDVFPENLVTNTMAWSSGRQVSPVLGLSWANCINTRLFLTKEVDSDGGSTRRHMKVSFAPHLPERSCEFVIRRDGVFGVEAVQRFLSTANAAEQTRLHSPQPISSHRLNSDYIQPEDGYSTCSDEDFYIEPEDFYIEPEDFYVEQEEDDYFSDEDE